MVFFTFLSFILFYFYSFTLILNLIYLIYCSVMSVTLSSLPGKFKCSILNSFLVLMELLPTPV